MVASPLLSVAPQFGPQVSDKRLETCLQTRNGNPHSRVWAPTQELVLRRYFFNRGSLYEWVDYPAASLGSVAYVLFDFAFGPGIEGLVAFVFYVLISSPFGSSRV